MFNIDDNIDLVNHPGAGCADFCAMGVNGACVSELEEPPPNAPATPGTHVYQRRRQEPDGNRSIELVIFQEGGSIFRKTFPYADLGIQ